MGAARGTGGLKGGRRGGGGAGGGGGGGGGAAPQAGGHEEGPRAGGRNLREGWLNPPSVLLSAAGAAGVAGGQGADGAQLPLEVHGWGLTDKGVATAQGSRREAKINWWVMGQPPLDMGALDAREFVMGGTACGGNEDGVEGLGGSRWGGAQAGLGRWPWQGNRAMAGRQGGRAMAG